MIAKLKGCELYLRTVFLTKKEGGVKIFAVGYQKIIGFQFGAE